MAMHDLEPPGPVDPIHTAELQAFADSHVPMIAALRPQVRAVTPTRYELSVALSRETSNQLGAMYFGALAMGAELAPLCHGLVLGRLEGYATLFITSRVEAKFVAPARDEVVFRTDDGPVIGAAVRQAAEEKRAVIADTRVIAFCGDRIVAEFEVAVSVKVTGPTAVVPLDRRQR